MKLLQIRLVGLGPFEDVAFSLCNANDEPRPMTVIWGGSGVGKTTLLLAIANTRPGRAVIINPTVGAKATGFAVADWQLGDDDPERPHPLRVTSPNATIDDTSEESSIRRREQGLFDRQALEQGGFVVLYQSASRWFSRSPLTISSPMQTILRQNVRAAAYFDDAGRADLARDTKQALVFAGIASRLPDPETARPVTALGVLDEAMRDMLHRLLSLVAVRYVGVDPMSLEPLFLVRDEELVTFDRLPNSVRHLVSFAVLTIRGLFAAYPGRDPRMTEGVVLIDEVGLHQESSVQRGLVGALRGCLPRVQWILTTSSAEVAGHCEPNEVLALRRLPKSRGVQVFEGESATLH